MTCSATIVSNSACPASSRRGWQFLARRAIPGKTAHTTPETHLVVHRFRGGTPAFAGHSQTPVAQARSSAGPVGSNGSSSRTMLAGSEGGASAASLCLASQSAWLEGIKKAPELTAQEPERMVLQARGALPCTELDAEGAAAAAG